jgi:hypothetical protein
MRLCGRRFGNLQVVFFMEKFWNFKAILKNHFDVCSKQTCSEKFKRFSWIVCMSVEKFYFAFGENMK